MAFRIAGENMIADVTIIDVTSSTSPSTIRKALGTHAFRQVWAIGNLKILEQPLLGFFCSTTCPGEVILRTYDLAIALREAGVSLIGGFHTPLEKECLALLLRGTQPLVICPARSIAQMRLPAAWRQAVMAERLLLLSPFAAQYRRPTVELTEQRNRFVAAMAAHILVAHAAAQSKTATLCLELLRQGKQVFALTHTANDYLLTAGAHRAMITALCTAVSGPPDDPGC
jgi:predicted Rossmann fold nucleotide-binding protein DprA/Smf involved in DNA uptake